MIEKIRNWYDEFMWQNGLERKIIVHNKLKAHELAVREGRNSPYTHPEDYPNGFYQETKREG